MTGTVATQVKAIAFDRDIERLTEGFTGREWVFEEIDRWLQQGNERFFILTGEPGVGKSAIAAQLTQTRKDIAAYHFCIARQISTVEPNNVLLSLAAQLIKYFPDYGEALVNTVKPLFLQVNVEINIENIRDSVVQGVVIENLHIHYPKQALDIVLRQALAALPNPPKEPVSILIDSLDEAVTYSNENNLVTLLSSVDDLPSWVRFILTSRPDKQRVLSYFETLKPYYYHLNELSEKNKEDIHQYVDGRVLSEPIQAQIQRFEIQSEALINQITELSQGNFLYTKVLLDDIELGGQPIDNLAALPKSLNELYHNFLLRLKAEWEGKYQPIFGILTVTKAPVTEEELTNLLSEQLDETELGQRLRVVEQFLDVVQNDYAENTYSLFHQSLQDYLTDKENSGVFHCSLKDGHRQIIEYCWQYHPRDWRECDRYGLRYLATHLVDMAALEKPPIKARKYIEKLHEALLTFNWLQAKLKTTSVNNLIEDFDLLLNTGIDDQPVHLVERAIRLSAHLLSQYPSLLWEQLYGRLITYKIPEIQAILAHSPKSVWFRPLFASLATAGGSLLCTLEGHCDTVVAVTITPDGKQALSASKDCTLRLWDLEAGICLKSLRGHEGYIRDVVVISSDKEWTKSDQKWAVSASDDGTIKLWNLLTGECIKNLGQYNSPITSLTVTNDNHVLSVSNDGIIRLWNVQTGKCHTVLEGHSGEIVAIKVTRNGQIFLGSIGGTLQRWNQQTGEFQTIVERSDFDGSYRYFGKFNKTIAFTSDGRYALSIPNWAFYTGEIKLELWDLQTETFLPPLNPTDPGARSIFETLAISPDDRSVVLGTHSGRLQRWDLQTGHCLVSFQGHNYPICALAISPDSTRAISAASHDNVLKLWDLQTVSYPELLESHGEEVTAIAISPKGEQVVSASFYKLKLWDLQTGKCLKTIEHGNDSALKITPDGKRAILGSKNSALEFCDLVTEVYQTVAEEGNGIRPLAISSDGQWGLTASDRHTFLRLWNLQTETYQEIEEHGDSITAIAISPNGERAIVGLKNGNLKLWDLKTENCQILLERMRNDWINAVVAKQNDRQVIAQFPCTFNLRNMQAKIIDISPSGDHIIVGCAYTLELWNLQTKTFKILEVGYDMIEPHSVMNASWDSQMNTFRYHTVLEYKPLLKITALVFTPDSKKAISASRDGTLKLWDLAIGEGITIWGGDSAILCCAISPDGTTVVAGEESGQVHFLKLEGV